VEIQTPVAEHEHRGFLMKEQVALFGGSFNPPHIGHTLAITYALSQHVDRVLVVPTFKHALGKGLIPFEHRMEMAKLAFSWLNGNDLFLKVSVLDIEQKIGHSRTLDTINALYKRFSSDIQLRLLVGADVLDERDKWHNFNEIVKLAPPIYIGRNGYDHSDTRGSLNLPEVSSTYIRNQFDSKSKFRFANVPDIESTVHPKVRAYIYKHGLYEAS